MKSDRWLIPVLMDIKAYLEKPDGILYYADTGRKLTERTGDLIERIRAADDRIVIGLVGGTGVGKSTLINALAGREISASTELRPTTSRMVLYRHRENDFSLSSDEEVHRHDSPLLRRVSLADFPDFDSIEPHHREALARHFPELDLLLWVVDPVKYADQALFEWLSLAPQASINSLFVFNKIDEYEKRYQDEAAGVVGDVIRDFTDKLTAYAGLEEPEVLAVSSLSIIRGWDGLGTAGFEELQGKLEHLADKKRRLSIKEQNLAAMTHQVLVDLVEGASLDRAGLGLEKLEKSLDRGRKDVAVLIQTEADRLRTLLRRRWRAGLASTARDAAPWPFDFLFFIWDGLKGLFSRNKTPKTDTPPLPSPELTPLVRRLTNWQSEMTGAFGFDESGPRRALADRMARGPAPDVVAETGASALITQGIEQSRKLARRFRWRVRHHLLPLLVLSYPFLPVVLGWITPLITGDPSAAPDVQISLGWRDLLPLVEIVLGLYLLQAIYYAFRLDRAADKALIELADLWEEQSSEAIDRDLIAPVTGFMEELNAEIDIVKSFSRSLEE